MRSQEWTIKGDGHTGSRTSRDVLSCVLDGEISFETMSWARCQAVKYRGMWRLDVLDILCDVFVVVSGSKSLDTMSRSTLRGTTELVQNFRL